MKKLLLLALLSTTFNFFSQSISLDNENSSKPFIEVTGTAEKEIVPDRIFIAILLTEKTVNNQDFSIQTQEEKLKEIIRKNKIDNKNLFLSDAISEITKNKKKETGIKLTKEYTLILKDADEVNRVFQDLTDINIKEITIKKTESSQIEKFRKEVREEAIKAAKNKAEYLLTAIGEQIGKPLEIKELGEGSTRSLVSNGIIRSEEKNLQTSFEKIVVKFSYFIKYSIK